MSAITNLPVKFVPKSPMIYGMKLNYRLKGSQEIVSLWFENREVPVWIDYALKKCCDWHEWKATKPIIPSSYKPQAPSTFNSATPVSHIPSKASGHDSRGIIYTVEWIYHEDNKIYREEFKDRVPVEFKAFLKPLVAWFNIAEKLPENKQVVIETKEAFVTNQALCICHETGIKFTVDLNVPVRFKFAMLHPVAIFQNAQELIKRQMQIGLKLELFEGQILAGLLITLLKHYNLFEIHELTAQATNEKLVRECSLELLAKTVTYLHSLKSAVGLPKFKLSGDFRFDWQVINYLRILKGEDDTVGTRASQTTPATFKAKIVSTKQTNWSKDACFYIEELTKESPKDRVFLMRLKGFAKNIEMLDEKTRVKLIEQIEDQLPLSTSTEALINCFENAPNNSLDSDDLLSLSQQDQEPRAVNLVELLKRKEK